MDKVKIDRINELGRLAKLYMNQTKDGADN